MAFKMKGFPMRNSTSALKQTNKELEQDQIAQVEPKVTKHYNDLESLEGLVMDAEVALNNYLDKFPPGTKGYNKNEHRKLQLASTNAKKAVSSHE